MRKALLALGWLWASPTTLLGILLAMAGGAHFYKLRPAWVIQCRATRGLWAWFFEKYDKAAITIGFCTIFEEGFEDDPVMLAHEQVHSIQAACWGPLFIPAYYAASAGAWMAGKDPYMDNPFESEAYAKEHEPSAWT